MIPEDKDHFRSGRSWTRVISLEQVPKVRPLIRKNFTNEGISLMHENTPAAAVLSSNRGFLLQRNSKCIPWGRELSPPPSQLCRVFQDDKGLHFPSHKGGWEEMVPQMDETWFESTFGFYTTLKILCSYGEAPTTTSGSLWVLQWQERGEWGLWWLWKL